MVSDYQLKVFYSSERLLFTRLVVNYAVEPTLAVLTIALWLFLESAGHLSVIHFVLKSDDNGLVASLAIEAQRILRYLRDPSAVIPMSVEWTARLLRRAFSIEEFGERRSEIIPWINETVVNSLSRSLEDLYMVPAHAVGYLAEVVPLMHEEPKTNLIGSRRSTELFPHATGCAYPWTGLAGDLVKPFIKPSLFGMPLRKEEMQQPDSYKTAAGLEPGSVMPRTSRVEPLGQPVHNMNLEGSSSRLGVQTMVHPAYSIARHEWGAGSSSSSIQPAMLPAGVVRFVPYPHEVVVDPYHGGAVGLIHQVPYPVGQAQLPNVSSPFTVVPAGAFERRDMESSDASACYSPDHFDEDSDSGTDGSDSEAVGDGRTLFVTFSRGYPLEAQELRDYVTSVYGDVVERVMLQRTKGTRPLFAKLVLTSPEALAAVLNGEKKVKMVIQGRDAWARVYKRKKKSQQRQVRRELLRRP